MLLVYIVFINCIFKIPGLLVRLSPMFPDELMVGIEIRVKVIYFINLINYK